MTMGEIIKQLRLERGITQEELGKVIGVQKSAIRKYESGMVENIKRSSIKKLADYFGVTPSYILGWEDKKEETDLSKVKNIMPIPNAIKMPIIGSISAGYNGLAQEEFEGYVDVLEMAVRHYSPSECFVLRVKGNSMYPDFRDNDLVMVHKQEHVDSGTTAVVLYNGDEATLKQVKYVQGEDWVDLIPRNPEYETKRIKGDDLQYCRVIGKVLSLVLRQEN